MLALLVNSISFIYRTYSILMKDRQKYRYFVMDLLTLSISQGWHVNRDARKQNVGWFLVKVANIRT